MKIRILISCRVDINGDKSIFNVLFKKMALENVLSGCPSDVQAAKVFELSCVRTFKLFSSWYRYVSSLACRDDKS